MLDYDGLEFAPNKRLPDRDTAWLYIITLTYNNHYDWRMPSITIVEIDNTLTVCPWRPKDA